jgi:hypothetical protein
VLLMLGLFYAPVSASFLSGLSIFHDPGKGSNTQGQQTKTLKVTASSAGEGGILVSLSQAGTTAAKTSVAVPVTRSEYVSNVNSLPWDASSASAEFLPLQV